MCQTHYYKSRQCNHSWLELAHPCGPDMNLVTCPDFGTLQPFGPADKPRRCRWAPYGECPSCDYDEYDRRKRRLMVVKRFGWRFGLGPGKDSLGVDVFTQRGGAGGLRGGAGDLRTRGRGSLEQFGSCGVM